MGSRVATARRPRARGRDKQEHQSDDDDSARTPIRGEDRNEVVVYQGEGAGRRLTMLCVDG